MENRLSPYRFSLKADMWHRLQSWLSPKVELFRMTSARLPIFVNLRSVLEMAFSSAVEWQ
jgi:hypothetical protein